MRYSKPMDDQIQIRVAKEEKRQMLQAALVQGLSLSDFIRHSATEAARRVTA